MLGEELEVPVRGDGAPPVQPAGSRRGGGRRLGVTLLAVLGTVVVGVVLGILIIRLVSPTTPAAQAPPSQPSSSSQAPRIEEALPRSGIVAGAGGIGNIYELRTGFSKN